MLIHQVLFPKTRSGILALCFLHPGRRFYLREIAQRLGAGHSTVQSELEKLTEVELLVETREGKRAYYQANVDCVVFLELKELLDKTIGPVGRIRDALRTVTEDIDFAFIYGSVAKDAASDKSDVDLMVIGNVPLKGLIRVLRPLQEELRSEINPSIFSKAEFIGKLRNGSPFLENVMENPKKMVMGDEHELGKLA